MFTWLAALTATCVIVCTVLPLVRYEVWWIRLFDFPRVQLLAMGGSVLPVYLHVIDWRDWVDAGILMGLIICVIYQAACIVPYTAVWPAQLRSSVDVRKHDTLSMISANVFTPNRNATELTAIIQANDPDIVLAIETDGWWDRQLDELHSSHPYSVRHPLGNLYGMHLYSRLRLIEPVVKFLVEDDKPSIHAQVELRSGQKVMLHCLHPAPPAPTENQTSQERDAELILVAKSVQKQELPTIVVGDLNDVAWSSTTRLFQKISGLLDPRVGRGMFNSFHTGYPFIRWPLDHVFCTSDFELLSLRRLDKFGSDHFPIYVVLQHVPAAQSQHSVPEASSRDHARASEKLQNLD